MSLPYWPRSSYTASTSTNPRVVITPGQAFTAGSSSYLQFDVKPGHSYATYFTASNVGWSSVSTSNPGITFSLTTDLNTQSNATVTPLLTSNVISYLPNATYSVPMFLTVPSSSSNTVPCYFRCNMYDPNVIANYGGVLTSGLYLYDLGSNV